ncbi:MAG: precorrin-2 C(20)-methyltransferase [Hyphomicrobiales bacterium]
MKPKFGTLYGIGVGPGDPDLITLKATKVLRRVDIVFAAASTKNHHSLAMSIARPHIPDATPVELLRFPMTRDRSETRRAWEANAQRIVGELTAGRDAAFLTLGDSLTYSTFGYLMAYVRAAAPSVKILTVPGITSYQAAASRLNTTLVEGEGSLMVVSGATGGDRLRSLAEKPETVVFLKAYRNLEDICSALDESGQYPYCVAVKNCGHPTEEIVKDLDELCRQKPDYWTLIIAKKNASHEPDSE